MAFADRAVAACGRAMASGNLSERQVRDVLKCKTAEVWRLEKYLKSPDPMVRRAAGRIIGKFGEVQPLLDAAMKESDQMVLREFLHVIGERGEGAEVLERMVNAEDQFVREDVISMLRKAGKVDSLLPLLFDRDDDLVRRVKRYIHEQESELEDTSA